MPSNRKIYLIGSLLILLAVLIVLLSVFLPRAVKKSDMKELLRKTQEGTLMALMDPLYQTEEFLGNRGKEVLLSEAETQELKTLLAVVAHSGYRFVGQTVKFGGGMDMRLQVRIGEVETVYLWFDAAAFYCMRGELAIRFSAKDTDAYAALYGKMRMLIETAAE
ncbi:MAG: hypothetical protein E7585_08035 [Ruminococcaceae bacterium]|nr:hypothetical protein [Oscillospiraceae bacterium]